MIAVSDTSPICYLILIGEISILPRLFSSVLVPQAVLNELHHDDAPELIRSGRSLLHLGLPSSDTRRTRSQLRSARTRGVATLS